jgi:hypothetical protein
LPAQVRGHCPKHDRIGLVELALEARQVVRETGTRLSIGGIG